MADTKPDTKPDKETTLREGGDQSAVKQHKQTEVQQKGEATRAPLNGRVVSRDPRRAAQPDLADVSTPAPVTVVDEDVYEEFYVDNVKRPLYRRLLRRGQVISTDEYNRLMEGQADTSTVGDISQQVVGAEGKVGGTVEPKGPAKPDRG